MAPTSKSTPSPGSDAKPNIAAMNSISMLMASKFKPDPSLLARKSAASQGSNASSSKHQLARAEALELEHLASFDDNWGVGMVRPASEFAAQRAKQKEERKLKMKLLGKRKVEEEARERRLRDVDSSGEEEESRAAIGRAKKRVRREPVEERSQVGKSSDEMRKLEGGEIEASQHAAAESVDAQMSGIEKDTGKEIPQAKVDIEAAPEDGGEHQAVGNEAGLPKKKHKKKKKKQKSLAVHTNE